MKKTRKATCPVFSPRNMNYVTILESHAPSSPSPASSSRTFSASRHPRDPSVTQPACNMSSLMAGLPESPSPVCSHGSSSLATGACSPKSDTYYSYSEMASEFATPRNQSFGASSNENNHTASFSEIDDWLEHANRFCRSSTCLIETDNLNRNGSPEDKLSMSSMCKTFRVAPDHELYSITLPSVREESPVYEGQSRLACINSLYGASKSGSNRDERRRSLCRPKPYNAFLDELERQKQEAEREAWRKAKHVKLMERMRRKEAAIEQWELQQTRKAVEKMEKLQNKLERKQLQVSAKTQKKICSVKEKAERQKLNIRQSTMEKISLSSDISDTHSYRNFMSLKLGPHC